MLINNENINEVEEINFFSSIQCVVSLRNVNLLYFALEWLIFLKTHFVYLPHFLRRLHALDDSNKFS